MAFTEEAQQGLRPNGHLPITSGGSYVLAPAEAIHGLKPIRLELCLARPSAGLLAPRLRTRVICRIQRGKGSKFWELEAIEV